MSDLIFPLNIKYKDSLINDKVKKNGLYLSIDGIILKDNIYYREIIDIPWTSSIYIVCLDENIGKIKNLINNFLSIHGMVNIMRIIKECDVCRIFKPNDCLFWKYNRNNTLFSIVLDSFKTRRVLLNFLIENSTENSSLYGLPILQDNNINIDILLKTRLYFSKKILSKNNEDYSILSWCTFDYNNGNYLRKLSSKEIKNNNIIENILNHLPIMVYDIETIGKNDNILPRGNEYDQAISTFAITIHHPDLPNIYDSLVLLNANLINDETLIEFDKNINCHFSSIDKREKGGVRNTKVISYSNEINLLKSLYYIMSKNIIVKDFLSENREDIKDNVCSILYGYNSDEYDFIFIISRLFYHGMYDIANDLLVLINRFSFSQISFDLYKHIKQRHIVNGPYTLSNVCNFFGATKNLNLENEAFFKKMNFNSISIRKNYTFSDEDSTYTLNISEKFENIIEMIKYNIQDCVCVYYLSINILFLENVQIYARHFLLPVNIVYSCGNSRLLPNSLFTIVIEKFHLLLEHKDNFFSQIYMSKKLKFSFSFNDFLDSENNTTINNSNDSSSDRFLIFNQRQLLRQDKKRYLGGLNYAINGCYENSIHLDFSSFYPSQACYYNLSFETVSVFPLWILIRINNHLLSSGGIDKLLERNIMRIFDYENENNTNRNLSFKFSKGKSDLETRMIKNINWYEGIEFTSFKDIIESSANNNRRFLIIRNNRNIIDYSSSFLNKDNKKVSIISVLWKYYLNKRKEVKLKLKNETNEFLIKFLTSMEQIYKRLANSLYGYLNFNQSFVFCPQVSAAITLLARKTFHESVWICENILYMKVVYKDTDGMICIKKDNKTYDFDMKDLGKYITNIFNRDGVVLEYEHESRYVVIMGMKKYWFFKSSSLDNLIMMNNKFVSKGFEKNSGKIIKELVQRIQFKLISLILNNKIYGKYKFIIDLREFFKSIYSFLYKELLNGNFSIRDFSFNITLTPRVNNLGRESKFIDRVLSNCNYDIGDKIKCLYLYKEENDEDGNRLNSLKLSNFILLEEFNVEKDFINFFKFINRFTKYLIQIIEGCKRFELSESNEYSEYLILSNKIQNIAGESFIEWNDDIKRRGVKNNLYKYDYFFDPNNYEYSVEHLYLDCKD